MRFGDDAILPMGPRVGVWRDDVDEEEAAAAAAGSDVARLVSTLRPFNSE